MKTTCAFCLAPMGEKAPFEDPSPTPGMCAGCVDHFSHQWDGLPLAEWLGRFTFPVIVSEPGREVAAANRPAAELVGREHQRYLGILGAAMAECGLARRPGGCGRAVCCSSCTIRRMVEQTQTSGVGASRVPAFHEQGGWSEPIVVSTEKIGHLVRVRVERSEGAGPGVREPQPERPTPQLPGLDETEAEAFLREAVIRRARELEELSRHFRIAAHDFNNALAVLNGGLAQLEDEPQLSATGLEAVADIRAAVTQATATIRHLRTIVPRPEHPTAPLPLARLVQRASTLFRRVLPERITVAVEIAEEPVVVADEGQLMRLLTNLALNARDAMPDGGRLTFRVRRAADAGAERAEALAFTALDVEDTGSGMTDEVKARLFQPYQTSKGGAGSGLGLVSVRQIVEAAGGRVVVRSELGRGTTVTVLWPVASDD